MTLIEGASRTSVYRLCSGAFELIDRIQPANTSPTFSVDDGDIGLSGNGKYVSPSRVLYSKPVNNAGQITHFVFDYIL